MSTEWSEWTGSGEEWDALLASMPNPSVHQGHRWGEHRRRFGWTPLRLVARRGGTVVAMVQANVRTLLGVVGVAWMPGGPVGDLEVCGEPLRRALSHAIGARWTVVRMNPDRPRTGDDEGTLVRNGWRRSPSPLLSGTTLHYRLDLPEDERLALLSRNWRHNLRRGQKRGFSVSRWDDPSPELIARAYDEMHEFKGVGHLSARTTCEWIGSVLESFGEDCVVVRCDDADGSLVALRGALILGDRAWDTFAAATPAGRRNYASYVAFWALTDLCARRGVVAYDMGGADPVNNRGVYDFKRGTGADPVVLAGEWEHSRPRLLGTLVSRRVARRTD